jgi:hypothetical protein
MKSTIPSPGLIVAALAGLCEGCGDGTESGSGVLSERVVPALDAATFDEQCAERAGVLQFHAHCGGVNLCRGLSYDTETLVLSEHTCRGLNTCGGMSCVELQHDRGREADALYAASCASCHGGAGTFVLAVPAATSPEAEAARFASTSTLAKSAAIAFGEDGAGIALRAEHAFYEQLSRAEVLRLVAHVDALPLEVKPEAKGITSRSSARTSLGTRGRQSVASRA